MTATTAVWVVDPADKATALVTATGPSDLRLVTVRVQIAPSNLAYAITAAPWRTSGEGQR